MTIVHTNTSVSSALLLIIGLLWCFLLLICVHPVIGFRPLSKDEDLQIQKTFHLLSKPAVTAIKTIYGDEYNCVDFYQQPAFDHPVLKHRASEFKMRATNYSSLEKSWVTKMWENGKGCPSGSVPIKKYTKHDVIQAKRMSEIHVASSTHPADFEDPDSRHAAVISHTSNAYGGISMFTSLYNPKVTDTQYSASQMKLSRGEEFIQTGWMVVPSLYHDHRTRLFIFTMTKNGHCFNDFCSTFVRDSSSVPLDYAFEEISESGGQKHDWKFQINTNLNGEYWLLRIGSKDSNMLIGFWPKSLFAAEGLAKFADKVEWGGEVYGPLGSDPFPEMGSGSHEFKETSEFTAYSRNLKVQIETGPFTNVPDGIRTLEQSIYRMQYAANEGTDFEQHCFFDGPIGVQ